ncbi:hypothetical protein Tco_1075231, partial [Tanacetum coccineum]
MSNTNNTMQTKTSNALHNAIMEAGGKDRPPMLAPESTIQVSNGLRRLFQLLKAVLKQLQKGIDNDIYSTVDACPNACKMWKTIERLKQGESINVQDLETNLYCMFGKFTSRDGESLESYYSRFYKMMNELVKNQCDVTNHQVNVQFLFQLQPEWQRFVTLIKQSKVLKTVSYHKLYDILKQHQNEVNKIRAERLARTANPLTLNRGTGYENQRVVDVARARENVGTQDAAYHKEKILLCKQEEAGVKLNAEQADWKDDTNDESDKQELEAHYMYMAQIQELLKLLLTFLDLSLMMSHYK